MTDNHAMLLDGYKAIAEILDRHNIRYYGMYGTALGAVRHNGFIPWDDDLDLAIFAQDLDVINDVLSRELDPAKYYYHNPSADSHPHVIIKTPDFHEEIKNRKVTFIDLFVLVDSPKSKLGIILIYPFCGFELLSHKIIDSTNIKPVKWLFYKVMLVSRKIIRLISSSKSGYVGTRFPNVSQNIWKKEYFGEPVKHVFEDTTIPLPNQCDKFLTEYYGDYMTPPPEDQRAGASGFPYSLLNDYQEDMNEGKKHRRLLKKDMPK